MHSDTFSSVPMLVLTRFKAVRTDSRGEIVLLKSSLLFYCLPHRFVSWHRRLAGFWRRTGRRLPASSESGRRRSVRARRHRSGSGRSGSAKSRCGAGVGGMLREQRDSYR